MDLRKIFVLSTSRGPVPQSRASSQTQRTEVSRDWTTLHMRIRNKGQWTVALPPTCWHDLMHRTRPPETLAKVLRQLIQLASIQAALEAPSWQEGGAVEWGWEFSARVSLTPPCTATSVSKISIWQGWHFPFSCVNVAGIFFLFHGGVKTDRRRTHTLWQTPNELRISEATNVSENRQYTLNDLLKSSPTQQYGPVCGLLG